MIPNRLLRRVVPHSVAFCLVVVASGQTPPSDQHMDNGARRMMKSADTAFALKAVQGGLAEVKLGRLAAEKGASPDVKAFGQQMVEDHGKANERLKAAAESEGMTLPADVNGTQQAMYDRLSKLSGAQFDSAYVKDMMMDHQEDIKEFKKEAQSGTDEQMKSFASQTLPVIEGHLEKLKSIQPKLAPSSK
jgi:putative membrane protein